MNSSSVSKPAFPITYSIVALHEYHARELEISIYNNFV